MTDHAEYFAYLSQRRFSGLLYRRLWLYPIINHYLRGRVLDIGCGIGDFLRYRPGTVGVDVNPETVAWCQSQGLDARVMEVEKLPFDDEVIDSILLDNVLEHIEDPLPLLKEVYRSLVRDGIFLVGVPGPLGYDADADHKKYYDKQSLISALEAVGFKKKKLFSTPLNIERLGRHLRQYCVYGVFAK